MKPQNKKLPESMRHKQLDLRKHSKQLKPNQNTTSFNNTTRSQVDNLKPAVLSQPTTINKPVESKDPQAVTTAHQPTIKNKKPKKRLKMILLLLLAMILLAVSIYILVLMFLPKIQKQSPKEVQNTVEQAIKQDKDMVLIPAAGINAEIAEGDANILDKGLVWHRFPERGDPSKGGNTILTGHSFVWGYTPQQIKEQSIFYNLNEVKKGDEVTVVWDKKTYEYTVSDIKEVKPNATDIENKTTDPILTIYTCTQGGAADGRVVVIAKPK